MIWQLKRAQIFDGLWNWAGSIHAIMLRETRCRYAGDPMGYLWTFIVPLLWIGTLMAFFTLVDRTPSIPVDTSIFIATGVVPYVLFRYTIASMARMANTHRHLVNFNNTRLSDVLIAAAILEYLNALVIFALTACLIILCFNYIEIFDPLKTLHGIALTGLFAAASGRLAAILGLVSRTMQRIIPVVLRPMFWISGIFFTATEIPPSLLVYLQWNPLLHAVEITRSGVFLDYSTSFASPSIPICVSVGFLFTSYIIQTAFFRGYDGRELS